MKISRWLLLTLPLFCYGLGFGLNSVVITANNGVMPVQKNGCNKEMMEDIGEAQIHACMDDKTKLRYLADWIFIRHIGVASPGDFLMLAFDETLYPCLFAWFVLALNDKGLFKH